METARLESSRAAREDPLTGHSDPPANRSHKAISKRKEPQWSRSRPNSCGAPSSGSSSPLRSPPGRSRSAPRRRRRTGARPRALLTGSTARRVVLERRHHRLHLEQRRHGRRLGVRSRRAALADQRPRRPHPLHQALFFLHLPLVCRRDFLGDAVGQAVSGRPGGRTGGPEPRLQRHTQPARHRGVHEREGVRHRARSRPERRQHLAPLLPGRRRGLDLTEQLHLATEHLHRRRPDRAFSGARRPQPSSPHGRARACACRRCPHKQRRLRRAEDGRPDARAPRMWNTHRRAASATARCGRAHQMQPAPRQLATSWAVRTPATATSARHAHCRQKR
jgi:hypothetical protein